MDLAQFKPDSVASGLGLTAPGAGLRLPFAQAVPSHLKIDPIDDRLEIHQAKKGDRELRGTRSNAPMSLDGAEEVLDGVAMLAEQPAEVVDAARAARWDIDSGIGADRYFGAELTDDLRPSYNP